MKISSFSKLEVKTGAPRETGKFNTTVQVGETKVAEVARRLGIGLEALVKANPQIKDHNALKAGQDIRLPMDRPQPAPPAPRPPQNSAAFTTSSKMGDPLAKSMAQAMLKQSDSKTLQLEPLPIVVKERSTPFSEAYDRLFGAGKTGETEEKPPEQAEPSEREKQAADFLKTLHAAVNGDTAALDKIRSLPNVGLLDLEKMLESLGYDWGTLKTLVPDRVDKTADLTRESLSGNENAWVELQKEWTGHEPTAKQRKDHAKDPFGNWLDAERSFELWGIPTRPQEHIDRGKALQDALVNARNGDLNGLTKLGIDKNNVTPNYADELTSLLSPDRAPASPEVMIPGVGPVGKKPGAGSSNGGTSLIDKALETIINARKADPSILVKLGLDPKLFDGLLDLFNGWKAKGGPDVILPNNGAGDKPSSGTSPSAPQTSTPTPKSETAGGPGIDSSQGQAKPEVEWGRPGSTASKEDSGVSGDGAVKESSTPAGEANSLGTKEPSNALPGTAWSPDGTKIFVKGWNGETKEYENIDEYKAGMAEEAAKQQTSKPEESPKTTESDSTADSDSDSTDKTGSDSTTGGYRDTDASGYNNMTGSYATLRLSADPLPPNDGNSPSDVIEEPRIDAGTTPNVDPDNLESSATITKAAAPIDVHRDGSVQGPPPNPNDPSTQERR